MLSQTYLVGEHLNEGSFVVGNVFNDTFNLGWVAIKPHGQSPESMEQPSTDEGLKELQVGHLSASIPSGVISQTIIDEPAVDILVVLVSTINPCALSSEHLFQ